MILLLVLRLDLTISSYIKIEYQVDDCLNQNESNQTILFFKGKNPPPICLPIPRLAALRVCFRLTNVYFIGRNVHACVIFETQWNKETAFSYNFDCMRLGTDGVALVKPEDGGGLPHPSTTAGPDDGIEDYDENIADPTTKRPNKKKNALF